mgnify:FL=1
MIVLTILFVKGSVGDSAIAEQIDFETTGVILSGSFLILRIFYKNRHEIKTYSMLSSSPAQQRHKFDNERARSFPLLYIFYKTRKMTLIRPSCCLKEG